MEKSVIILAVLGYLGAMFRNNISRLISYLIKINSSSIMVNDTDHEIYFNTVKYINSLDNKILNNNVMLRSLHNNSERKWEVKRSLFPSFYTIRINVFTFIIINFTIDKLLDRPMNVISIKIVGKNHSKIKEEIIAEVSRIYTSDNFISSPHGPRTPVPSKTFDNLYINNKDKILSYIDNWIDSREFYKRHNIIYKMGILLHGNPGTGKSSFIVALSNYLQYNILIVDSKTLSMNYYELMDSMHSKTIIVFEDIDCLFNNLNRETNIEPKEKDDSLNRLLQLLDGINSPSDVVFVLTTNHKEKLDKALYRPGRINLDIHLSDIDKELALDMVRGFGQDDDILDEEEFPINPAYLQTKIINKVNRYYAI